jgi:hypothetical protein
LYREELMMLEENYYSANQRGVRQFALDGFQEDHLEFVGHKLRTKEELQKLMYHKVSLLFSPFPNP